jgi:D-alanine-D-alanine ligase
MKDSFHGTSKVNTKINLHVQIVGSSNPRLNAMVKDSQFTIAKTLRPYYRKVGISVVDTMADLEALVAKKPDLVVLGMKHVLLDPALEYDNSRKEWLSDYLLERGIAVTGSDTEALKLEFDKHEAKQVVIDAGLKSAAYFLSTADNPTFAHSLSFPLFVKPTNRGDSKGIDEKSVVYTKKNLHDKIVSVHKDFMSDALVEEYLSGKEYSVAVIRIPGSETLRAMPVELRAPMDRKGNRFLSEAVKESDVEKVFPVTEDAARDAVNKLAIGVFKALGARDYGRIDVRMDSLGVPSFIEANLMPGLSSNGYLSRCFMLNENVAYEEMILSIVSLASERCETLANSIIEQLANDLTGNEILA